VRHGRCEVFNIEPGSHLAILQFTERLKGEGINIGMDGRACWCDIVFVARLCRRLKYEEVYMRANESDSHGRDSMSLRMAS